MRETSTSPPSSSRSGGPAARSTGPPGTPARRADPTVSAEFRWRRAGLPQADPAPVADGGGHDGRGLAARISEAFSGARLDLAARTGAPPQGEGALPEARAARTLRSAGAGPSDLRLFVTFVAAMDRARDADRLWDDATDLYREAPWVFQPQEVSRRPLRELADLLGRSRVSQRHMTDVAAWRLIAESLSDTALTPVVRGAVLEGVGVVPEILTALRAQTPAGLRCSRCLPGRR